MVESIEDKLLRLAEGPVTTSKQEIFCQEYMRDFNVPQAYLRAGFTGKDPGSIMGRPAVKARIAELKAERVKESKLTIQKVLDSLVRIGEAAEAEGRLGNALRAWELLGKTFGLFTDKMQVEITTDKTAAELDEEIERLSTLVDREETLH